MSLSSELLLLIEFLDEFVFGVREAAWPLIRTDLNLTYAQIGVLLGVPGIVSSLVEPVIGVLGDTWRRRVLILGGGVVFALALLMAGASRSYALLLLAFILLYPASGAFVSLAQATLMDLAPDRREWNMARWTFAGSLGVVLGPLALSAAAVLAWGWRPLLMGSALLALAVVLVALRLRSGTAPRMAIATASDSTASDPVSTCDSVPDPETGGSAPTLDLPPETESAGLGALWVGLKGAVGALRRPDVRRWLALLQFSDLMLDILLGYLALYLVDVAGANPRQASTAVAVWTGLGLLGDFLIIRLLTRVEGLRYLRLSAAFELGFYAAFLLVPNWGAKLVMLGLLGLLNAGWYAILQAQLYTALPGQSGTAIAVSNVVGLAGSLVPLTLGLIAQRWGLRPTMWLLALGPIALLLGLPRMQPKP